MASISFDGHRFTLDGRRIWLVGGVVDHARIPAELWPQRLSAAAQLGINCVATTVMWNMHEHSPGVFRFTGQTDIKRFVRLAAERGLHVVLRIGPYVGGGWDAGGLPPWLGPDLEAGADRRKPALVIRTRQGEPVFLQAVARYFDAVMEQVRELQVTGSAGGPIVAIQIEQSWFCHHPAEAERYLEQLTRYLRESGCRVPLINANNLWQQVAGTIDGWAGQSHLFANCRQLRALVDDAPTIVGSLISGQCSVWGEGKGNHRPAEDLLRRMVEVSAAGAMFIVDPLCGGANMGFYGGRLAGGDDRFVTASHDCHAPISPTGQPTATFGDVKRFATFASQFADLLASSAHAGPTTVSASRLSVVQLTGPMGAVVYVMRDRADDEADRHVEMVTPDGQSLSVDMGSDTAAWFVLDANLAGVAKLDLTNLRPWALLDRRLLVMFGPAGSQGIFSIDGTVRQVTVPEGNEPTIIHHDALTIAILNEKQIDAAGIDGERLIVGIERIDEEGQPVPHGDFRESFYVGPDGTVDKHKLKAPPKPPVIKVGPWQRAGLETYTDGTAARFAAIDGPRSLEACGVDYGYGWYRIAVPKAVGKVNLLAPASGDRVHVYQGGKIKAVLGSGAGATMEPAGLTLGDEIVALADNMGRMSEGLVLNESKGIFGELYDVKAVKLTKPTVTSEPRPDVLAISAFLPEVSSDERGAYPRLHFDVKLTSVAMPLVLKLTGPRARSVVMINDQTIALDHLRGVTQWIVIKDHLKRGVNRITLALIDRFQDPLTPDPLTTTRLFHVQRIVTDKASWWFARWQMPDVSEYQPVGKAAANGPAFFRTTFTAPDRHRPIVLEVAGVSKGQVYLNGHNLGRYFVATAEGKAVGPQKRYLLPGPWLTEGDNELVLFDEHGKVPSGCRIVYEA
jgi:hypothetical protein